MQRWNMDGGRAPLYLSWKMRYAPWIQWSISQPFNGLLHWSLSFRTCRLAPLKHSWHYSNQQFRCFPKFISWREKYTPKCFINIFRYFKIIFSDLLLFCGSGFPRFGCQGYCKRMDRRKKWVEVSCLMKQVCISLRDPIFVAMDTCHSGDRRSI